MMKDIGDFITAIYDGLKIKGLLPEREIVKALRDRIIRKGKHSTKLPELGRAIGHIDEPKYSCPDDMINTGSVPLEDCMFLAYLVRWWKPKTIVEIGTWFGTSAVIMAANCDGEILSCDRNDVRVDDEIARFPNIQCSRGKSSSYLKRIKHICTADMAFIDGTLLAKDARRILRLFAPNKIKIVCHDWHLNKGKHNLALIQEAMGDRKHDVLIPRGTPYVMADGTSVNQYCFLILEGQDE